jgi:hypothetical protein
VDSVSDGACGIRVVWCILAGWFASAGLITSLAMLPLIFGNRGGVLDSDLAKAMSEGTHALFCLVFGGVVAWGAAAIGRKFKR